MENKIIKILCNDCPLEDNMRDISEFNKSDLSQGRYLCKEHKKIRRETWKNIRNQNLPDKLLCKGCGPAKGPKAISEFNISNIKNSDFWCKECSIDRTLSYKK